MNTTTFQKNSGTVALSRTFEVLDVTRECGVVTDVAQRTVTLRRVEGMVVATVDGQPADLKAAVLLLETASRVRLVTEEPAADKALACAVHKALGRLGYRQHYALAAEVLGYPVSSLAALSRDDLYTVLSYGYGQQGLPTPAVAA